MPQVMIRCPNTDRAVYTGLRYSWTIFDWVPLEEDPSVSCPACGEEHAWTKNDAFLRADGGGD